MPESIWRPRRIGAVVAAAAAVVVTVVVAAPVGAQSGRWSGSGFDPPFDDPAPSTHRSELTVSGTFQFAKTAPTDEITGAVITITDDPDDGYTPPEDCHLPSAIAFGGDGTDPSVSVDTLPFSYPGVAFECNGRYAVVATGSASDGDSYAMSRSLLVEILPSPVEHIAATTDPATGDVTVVWDPIADPAPDALGYVVERAGPAAEDGSPGDYADIATVAEGEPTSAADQLPAPGVYHYRVRAVRDGADGSVRSSVLTSATADADFPPPTTTTTTTTPPTTRTGPQIGNAVPVPTTAGRPTPPTTADTGFEETLDYGTRVVTERVDDPSELASEGPGGDSIVQDEGGGVGYLIPAAGALVMLIWAGHLAYINRLAKEL